MSLSQVIGQPRAVHVFQTALGQSRVAGGYLLSGPEGVGKTFTAIQFVKAANCLTQGTDSCDTCSHCRLIDRGEFPDLFVADSKGGRILKGSASERTGSTLVEILPRLHYPPVMGRRKIVILSPADGLTEEAGNMLLKTLEEPPSNTTFLLLTAREKSMLPTLVSRCQRLAFRPLSTEAVTTLLERRGHTGSDAEAAARSAGGSLGRAEALLAEGALADRTAVATFLLQQFTGDLQARVDAVEALLAHWEKTSDRIILDRVIQTGTLLAADLVLAGSGAQGEPILVEKRKEVVELARTLGMGGGVALAELMRELRQAAIHNENPRNVLHYLGNRLAQSHRNRSQAKGRRTDA